MQVKIYKNLHKKMFSVVDLQAKRVFKYTKNLAIQKIRFIVSERGRQRVLATKQKNVHAFIVGEEIIKDLPNLNLLKEITYNPYKNETFICENKPIFKADYVFIIDNKVYKYDAN